jgi:hypothetical protein
MTKKTKKEIGAHNDDRKSKIDSLNETINDNQSDDEFENEDENDSD